MITAIITFFILAKDRSVSQQRLIDWYYSLSRKTVNARENFWNVYCFATNQMQDESAKDNSQTAALIIKSRLMLNNELAFSSTSTVFKY